MDEHTVTLDKVLRETRTGDIWLFRGRSGPDRAIQTLSNAPVNHVGMTVALEDLPPLIWHAELGDKLLDYWTARSASLLAISPQSASQIFRLSALKSAGANVASTMAARSGAAGSGGVNAAVVHVPSARGATAAMDAPAHENEMLLIFDTSLFHAVVLSSLNVPESCTVSPLLNAGSALAIAPSVNV